MFGVTHRILFPTCCSSGMTVFHICILFLPLTYHLTYIRIVGRILTHTTFRDGIYILFDVTDPSIYIVFLPTMHCSPKDDASVLPANLCACV